MEGKIINLTANELKGVKNKKEFIELLKDKDKEKEVEMQRLHELEYRAYGKYNEATGNIVMSEWMSKADFAYYKELMKKHFDMDVE